MHLFSKKSVEKSIPNFDENITKFDSFKISKIKKNGEKYIFSSVFSGKEVKFYSYYQGLLKKGTSISVTGKLNKVKYSYGEYEFFVSELKINLTETFKNLVSIRKDFEELYNYISSNNFSITKLKELAENTLKTGKNADKIDKINDFIKLFEGQTVYDKLALLGLEDKIVNGLFFKYKEEAYNVVKTNPYIIIKDFGLPIKTCDKIAKIIGSFNKNDPRRISGTLYEIFRTARIQGHSYLSLEQLETRLNNYCQDGNTISDFTKELDYLVKTAEFVEINNNFYLGEVYKIEENIAKILSQRTKPSLFENPEEVKDTVSAKISEFELKNRFKLTESQKNAVLESVNNQILIITGGPGTGKTTIQSAIFNVLSEIYGEGNVEIMAPTGIASKNISKKTGAVARTVHSAIGLNPFGLKGALTFDVEEKLDAKCVIIDEMSMVSSDMFLRILKSIKRTTKLILVGDPDQLFSIEYGQVLSDLIKSSKIPCVSLNKGFRFQGSVLTNAAKIREGESDLNFDKDCLFVEIKDEYEVEYLRNKVNFENGIGNKEDLLNQKYILDKKYADIYEKRLKDAFKHYLSNGYDKEQIKVLSPFNGQFFGVVKSNEIIGSIFSDEGKMTLEKYFKTFKEGDVVVNTLNNKDLGIMNGDNGVIISIYEDYTGRRKVDAMDINFGGEKVTVKGADIKNIQHSYALTIHKSQGSGFPVVIIPLFDNYIGLYSKKLLYTAVTRSQGKVVFIGKKSLLKDVINNEIERNSGLSELINKNFSGKN